MTDRTNRIDATFASLKKRGQKAFVAYLTAGDPGLEQTVDLVCGLEEAGVDIVELGIPFSDPLADGVVIQMAAQRALHAGTTVSGVLEAVRKIRKRSQIPIVAFTYLNPIHRYGLERFYRDASSVGIDGVLILDLPPEESSTTPAPDNLRQIWLIAPTTPPSRVEQLARLSSGFVYYVSREGVTGMQEKIANSIPARVAEIRKHTQVPVCVGFGISNPEQARQVALQSDGAVIGSAIVKKIGEWGTNPDLVQKITSFVKPMAEATKAAASTINPK